VKNRYAAALLMAFTVIIPSSARAHEYWLEPDRFFLRVNENSPVSLFLGQGLRVEESRPFQPAKTTSFQLLSASGNFDLSGSVKEGDAPLFSFSADRQGNYLLSMERNLTYITLSAEKFEEYLREDGMEYVIAERERLGETGKPGKERYTRYIKSLIQVGDRRDRTYARKVGHKLEIVPVENPYSKRIGDTLPMVILFNGRPLAGRTVFVDNRDGVQHMSQSLSSDENGRIDIKLDKKGVWLVRLVFMQRCEKYCEGADWESFWSAFSFGSR